MTCPSCFAANEVNDAFCGGCGAPLRPAAPGSGHGQPTGTGYGPQPVGVGYGPQQAGAGQGQPAGYGLTPPPAGYGTPVGMVRVGFGPRLLAWLIDAVVLFAFYWLSDAGSWTGLMPWLVTAIYYIALWGAMGQTVGKLALGQTVLSADGQPLTWGKAAVRYLGWILSGVLLGVGFLMIAFGHEKQGLHDRLAGTIVVKKG